MTAIRILLADDHALVRAGIRALIQRIDGVQVVGEAGDGQDALRLVAAHQPDIALIDIGMPELNGLETTARITQEFPNVRVIILSVHDSEEYVLKALRAGAVGYLLKDSAKAELALALRAVANGENYLSPPVSKHVIAAYLQRAAHAPGPAEGAVPLQRLTPRQRQILQLIADGHTSQSIAGMLDISIKTVETHRSQLMDRLGIHDLAGLVRYAIHMGLTGGQPL